MLAVNAQQIEHVPQVISLVNKVLKNEVVAVYLYGSVLMGGLRPQSDVDFLMVIERALSHRMRRELVTELLSLSGAKASKGPARPIELTVLRRSALVPWRYPPRREFQYGEWLRASFEQGQLPQATIDPDVTILLATLRKASQALQGPPADALFEAIPLKDVHRAIRDSLSALLGNLYGDERNVLLTLARMWLTLATGEVASKAQAASWACARLPEAPGQLLELARSAYLGDCDDDWSAQGQQVEACARLMQAELDALLSY